ncbi:hypothetical protein ColKHC_09601 [Colletotrichum higginsianum]|nr:hypothetical protein ColKHC_09601 [Colletotrichum higginsianum]
MPGQRRRFTMADLDAASSSPKILSMNPKHDGFTCQSALAARSVPNAIFGGICSALLFPVQLDLLHLLQIPRRVCSSQVRASQLKRSRFGRPRPPPYRSRTLDSPSSNIPDGFASIPDLSVEK